MRRNVSVIGVGLLVVVVPLLSGCVSFKDDAPPLQRYLLHPVPPAQAGGRIPELEVSIVLARPEVAPGLDTERIAVVRDQRKLDYYAGARWAAPLPDVLHEFFVANLENRYKVAGLGDNPLHINARYRLEITVRDFQAEYVSDDTNMTPELRVTLVAAFANQDDDDMVLRLKRSRNAQSADNTLSSVTAGLERLLQDLYLEVLDEFVNTLRVVTGSMNIPAQHDYASN